jgi:nitric oxide dioxygenase
MTQDLSAAAIATVKATVPALRIHGVAITTRMYERLFEDAAIKALFNQDHHGPGGRQPKALAMAVVAYAENIDNLGALSGAVAAIATKHVNSHIRPAHYDAVATALLGAIGDVLGEAATPQILEAWGQAYWRLAGILQSREAELYALAPAG